MEQNSVMNMQQAPAEDTLQGGQGPMMQDDGVDDEEYASDIQQNLEAHLDSLPDEAKNFLAEYATIAEVAAVLRLVNGNEVGDYFDRFVDPSKKMQVVKVKAQPTAAPGPMAPQQANPQAQQAQPQAAPQQPQGKVLNI